MRVLTAGRSAIFFLSILFLNDLDVYGFSVKGGPVYTPFSRVRKNNGDQRLNARRQRSTALPVTSSAATTKSSAQGSLVVGKLASNLVKFAVGPTKAQAIKSAVSQTANGKEIALIAFFGWALVPIFRFVYNKCQPQGDDFQDTYFFRISQLVGQIAQIGGVVYALDVLTVVLGVLGFSVPNGFNVSMAKILYLLWASYRLAKFKEHVLIKKRGKKGVTNKLINAAIAVVTALGVLDILSVHTGLAVQSIFAVGGAGSLIVSLGSQNVASQIVNGLAIASTGKFYEGEKIMLVVDGKKLVGTVEKMNIMATDIRGNDETVMNVPNKQLANQRVGNITRGKWCSVTQTVWFSYDDIDKIAKVCNDIKTCIKERCPMLETETRIFRVSLDDFKRDHLEVVVDACFRLPPYSNAYYENRQQVMFAIADGAGKNDVRFDMPKVKVQTPSGDGVASKMLGRAE